MTPEEVARYDKYWNGVARDKIVPNADEKALEILNSQSKTAAGPCLSTIYNPELDAFFLLYKFLYRHHLLEQTFFLRIPICRCLSPLS